MWDILEEVIQGHPVVLNRAPTLHRLGVQAFEPVLVRGRAIKIHPLVRPPFNADFDSDEMGVHIPLRKEAQQEARTLLLSSNNIRSPADGRPVSTPSQDIVLGVYLLTAQDPSPTGAGRLFGSPREVLLAHNAGAVPTRAPIQLLYTGPVIVLTTAGGSKEIRRAEPVRYRRQRLETTVGRVILNDRLPRRLPFVNGLIKKRGLLQLVEYCYLQLGREKTVAMLDRLKDVGFRFATRSGISIGMDDMVVPEREEELVSRARQRGREDREGAAGRSDHAR